MRKNYLPKKLRQKNYLLMAVIFFIIFLIYAVTIVKLSG